MAVWEHPAYNEEKNHLADTLKVIANERKIAENDRMEAEGSLSNARMYDPDALPIREMLYARAVQTERNLAQAAKKPYFTRIDFTQTGDVPRTSYIGKYGALPTDSLEVAVVDRRAPVAGLVCMDQMMADVTNIPDVCEGDEVILLGGSIGVDEYADTAQLNRNESLARTGRRVPRVYLENGRVVQIADALA